MNSQTPDTPPSKGQGYSQPAPNSVPRTSVGLSISSSQRQTQQSNTKGEKHEYSLIPGIKSMINYLKQSAIIYKEQTIGDLIRDFDTSDSYEPSLYFITKQNIGKQGGYHMELADDSSSSNKYIKVSLKGPEGNAIVMSEYKHDMDRISTGGKTHIDNLNMYMEQISMDNYTEKYYTLFEEWIIPSLSNMTLQTIVNIDDISLNIAYNNKFENKNNQMKTDDEQKATYFIINYLYMYLWIYKAIICGNLISEEKLAWALSGSVLAPVLYFNAETKDVGIIPYTGEARMKALASNGSLLPSYSSIYSSQTDSNSASSAISMVVKPKEDIYYEKVKKKDGASSNITNYDSGGGGNAGVLPDNLEKFSINENDYQKVIFSKYEDSNQGNTEEVTKNVYTFTINPGSLDKYKFIFNDKELIPPTLLNIYSNDQKITSIINDLLNNINNIIISDSTAETAKTKIVELIKKINETFNDLNNSSITIQPTWDKDIINLCYVLNERQNFTSQYFVNFIKLMLKIYSNLSADDKIYDINVDVYNNFINSCIKHVETTIKNNNTKKQITKKQKTQITNKIQLFALFSKITHSYANIYYYAIKGAGDSYYNAMAGIISQGYTYTPSNATGADNDDSDDKNIGGNDRATYTMSGDRGLSSPYYITTSQNEASMGCAFMFSKIPQGSSFGANCLTDVARKYSRLLYLLVLEEETPSVTSTGQQQDKAPDARLDIQKDVRSDIQKDVIYWLYIHLSDHFLTDLSEGNVGTRIVKRKNKYDQFIDVTHIQSINEYNPGTICHLTTQNDEENSNYLYVKLNFLLNSEYNVCINDPYVDDQVFSTIFRKCLIHFIENDNDKNHSDVLNILKLNTYNVYNAINQLLLKLVQICISEKEIKQDYKNYQNMENFSSMVDDLDDSLKNYNAQEIRNNYEAYNPNYYISEVYDLLQISPYDIYDENDPIDIDSMKPYNIISNSTYGEVVFNSPSLSHFNAYIAKLITSNAPVANQSSRSTSSRGSTSASAINNNTNPKFEKLINFINKWINVLYVLIKWKPLFETDKDGITYETKISDDPDIDVIPLGFKHKLETIFGDETMFNGITIPGVISLLGYTDILKALIEYKIPGYSNQALGISSPNIFTNKMSKNADRTILHLASQYGQTACVELILKNFDQLYNITDKDGRTPLHTAVRYSYQLANEDNLPLVENTGGPRRRLNNVKILVAASGDKKCDYLKTIDNKKLTPLQMATQYNNENNLSDVIKYLRKEEQGCSGQFGDNGTTNKMAAKPQKNTNNTILSSSPSFDRFAQMDTDGASDSEPALKKQKLPQNGGTRKLMKRKIKFLKHNKTQRK